MGLRRGYGIEVSLAAEIGAGVWIGPFGGIKVINCRLAERCSIGRQTQGGRAEQLDGPQIGDGVCVGAHAKIFGPVQVGAYATIAPGAYTMKDGPGHSASLDQPDATPCRSHGRRDRRICRMRACQCSPPPLSYSAPQRGGRLARRSPRVKAALLLDSVHAAIAVRAASTM